VNDENEREQNAIRKSLIWSQASGSHRDSAVTRGRLRVPGHAEKRGLDLRQSWLSNPYQSSRAYHSTCDGQIRSQGRAEKYLTAVPD
jgi:hypothetical protein